MSKLFGRHRTLILYSFMYGPDRQAPCPMCTHLLDSILVCEINDRLCGFACAYLDDDDVLGALLENLHVSLACRGLGIRSLLRREVAKHAVALAKHASLHLSVVDSNTTARAFYEKLGARCVASSSWRAPDGSTIPTLTYQWSAVAKLISGGHAVR